MRREAEQGSLNLPSANQNPKKAQGVTQSESQGLTARGADGANPSLRAEDESGCLSPAVRQDWRVNPPSSPVSSGPRGLDGAPPPLQRAICLAESTYSNADLTGKPSHRHTGRNVSSGRTMGSQADTLN